MELVSISNEKLQYQCIRNALKILHDSKNNLNFFENQIYEFKCVNLQFEEFSNISKRNCDRGINCKKKMKYFDVRFSRTICWKKLNKG